MSGLGISHRITHIITHAVTHGQGSFPETPESGVASKYVRKLPTIEQLSRVKLEILDWAFGTPLNKFLGGANESFVEISISKLAFIRKCIRKG